MSQNVPITRPSKLVMRHGKVIPCPMPRGVDDSLWRSNYCPDRDPPYMPRPAIYTKVARKFSTASMTPSCRYTADYQFYNPSYPGRQPPMPDNPNISPWDGKRFFVMSETYKWINLVSECNPPTYNDRCRNYMSIRYFNLNDNCEWVFTHSSPRRSAGPWSRGASTWKLFPVYRCSRVLVYRKIKHDGLAYSNDDLRLPTYMLRPKGWKVRPVYDENGNVTTEGVRFDQSPPTLEPWGWHYGELTYPEWFAGSPQGLSMAAPEGWTTEHFNPADCVRDNIDMIDINALSGKSILCGLKQRAVGFNEHRTFLEAVPADCYHTLILECDVYYYKEYELNIVTNPDGARGIDGMSNYTFALYNIYGNAHVLI